MPLSDLAPVLAQSHTRKRAGAATSEGKRTAKALAQATAQAARRDSLAQRDAQAELERTQRFTSLFAAIGKRDAAAHALTVNPDDAAAHAAYLAYEREVSQGFALPIIPSDIRPGGRFARKSRELIVRNARQHTVGSLLLTSSGNDDLVTRAVELAYARGDVVTVPAADYGWRSLDGMRGNRVQQRSNWSATVPTLGGMYRAIRAAYALELSDARREVRTFSLDDAYDVIAERPASRSVAPLTDDERAPRRKPSPKDQRDAYAVSQGELTRATVSERVHAFLRREERMTDARRSFAFGMDSDAQRDADVDKTCVALLAEGETLDSISAYMGITRATLANRLTSARIVGRKVFHPETPVPFSPWTTPTVAFTRIAPDARATRRARVAVKTASDVIVTRAVKSERARRMSPITNGDVVSAPFTLTPEIRAQHDLKVADAESNAGEFANLETAAIARRARLDENAELLTFA